MALLKEGPGSHVAATLGGDNGRLLGRLAGAAVPDFEHRRSDGLHVTGAGRGDMAGLEHRPRAVTAIQRAEPLAQRVYEALRQDVLWGTFEGGGRLIESDLAARYGVSRTPVRAALKRLAGSGLLQASAGGAYWVHSPNPRELREIFDLRSLMEPYAAELAAANAAPEQLEQLQVMAEGGGDSYSSHGPIEGNVAFHCLIGAASGNDSLARTIQTLMERWRIQRISPAAPPHAWHSEIARAISLGRGELARDLMQRHIQDSAAFVMEALRMRVSD